MHHSGTVQAQTLIRAFVLVVLTCSSPPAVLRSFVQVSEQIVAQAQLFQTAWQRWGPTSTVLSCIGLQSTGWSSHLLLDLLMSRDEIPEQQEHAHDLILSHTDHMAACRGQGHAMLATEECELVVATTMKFIASPQLLVPPSGMAVAAGAIGCGGSSQHCQLG